MGRNRSRPVHLETQGDQLRNRHGKFSNPKIEFAGSERCFSQGEIKYRPPRPISDILSGMTSVTSYTQFTQEFMSNGYPMEVVAKIWKKNKHLL